MRYFDLPRALLLALFVSYVGALVQDGNRILRAATRRSDLLKRDTRITQKFESEAVYIEDVRQSNGDVFASAVKVASRKPILHLEEIEHLLQDVRCQDGRMMLHFVDASSAQDARAACHGGHGGTGGLIITSHQDCNREGERAIYKIDEVSFAEHGSALDIAVTEALWKDAFDSLNIDFGHIRYDHIYRRHSDFLQARRKRQDAMTVEIPTDTSDNSTDISFGLESELLDYSFMASDFVKGLDSIPNLPFGADLPVEMGCKNCSTRGQIVLTQGSLQLDTKHIDLIPDLFDGDDGGDDGKEISSVISGGYMDIAVAGMGARLDMFARLVRSGSYEIALFPLPITGFVIPGIGQASASFLPKISAGFEVDRELAVMYGIDVTIQDGAGIRVELGDLTNTTIRGIKGATLEALPFSSNITDVGITLSLAFTPTISVGFEFSDKLNALVTVSLELPRLDAKLTTGAGEQCNLLIGDKKAEPKNVNLTSLVLVETNVSVVIDVAAELALPLLPAPLDSAGTSVNIFSTNIPLMTMCANPVRGALKITKMAPAATIRADVATAQTPASSACTKHEANKPCTCATTTTTVYATPPTGAYASLPLRETAQPKGVTPYYPSAPTDSVYESKMPVKAPTGGNTNKPPPTSPSCTSLQTLRITISTSPVPTTLPSAPPAVVIISAPRSQPCNSSTPATADSSISTLQVSSIISQTSEVSMRLDTKSTTTSILSTTSPPKIEESKGFLAPLQSVTGTEGAASSTGPAVFTGAATLGIMGPPLSRDLGWQIAVLAAGIGFGMILV